MADTDRDLPHSDKKSGPGNTPGTPEKDPKDLPELAPIPGKPGDDPNEPKNTPPPHKQPNTANTIHNREQDPDHPSNRTLSPEADATPRPVAEGVHVDPAEMRTEQEKEAADNPDDPHAGVGPYAASVTARPAKTIEDEGIGPRTPYPTGNPPPPSVSASLSQGIWRGDEEEHRNGPNEGRDASIRDAFEASKNEYHRGDTIVDGPNREEARRKKDEDDRKKQRDQRPQSRIGGAQEVATPPHSGDQP